MQKNLKIKFERLGWQCFMDIAATLYAKKETTFIVEKHL